MVVFIIFYLFLGILNFCMLDEICNDINEVFKKRWHRILFRLSWIFLWPLYISFLLFALICGAIYTFFKNLVK